MSGSDEFWRCLDELYGHVPPAKSHACRADVVVAGECSKETAFEILDYFYAQGGNFIDTANNYQNEQSEAWVGEWMEKRGVRDQMVIATKVRNETDWSECPTYTFVI